MSDLFIEDYTPASFVVQGNSTIYGEQLIASGGKWNQNLKAKVEGGSKRQGWIFPMFRKGEISKLIKEITVDSGNPSEEKKDSASIKQSLSNKNITHQVITKSEYLALVSRVERLETLLKVQSSPTDVLAGSDNFEPSDQPEEKVTRFKKFVKK